MFKVAAVVMFDVVAVVDGAIRPLQNCHRHDGWCCIDRVDAIVVAVDSIPHGTFADVMTYGKVDVVSVIVLPAELISHGAFADGNPEYKVLTY